MGGHMGKIQELDQETINQIAAGEVIDRPGSVVKELLENAIDARAMAVTVEIRDGGISYIRITDNGTGFAKEDIPIAFRRHTTSKIRNVNDLLRVSSLGFRGEALSSIAAVAQVELLTKQRQDFTGYRYVLEDGEEKSFGEAGVPDGTTFLVRNLFGHTPARRKFLKSPATEAAYITEIVERIALSHPDISVRFIVNGQNKLHTSGNHNLKDTIYQVFGKEITSNLIPVDEERGSVKIAGFLGKPVISRGNRNFECYFINGRYIKSRLIAGAIEESFRPYLMQHKYPFAVLEFGLDPELLDVNVHPAKMELRFRNQEEIYRDICGILSDALREKPVITQETLPEHRQAEGGFPDQDPRHRQAEEGLPDQDPRHRQAEGGLPDQDQRVQERGEQHAGSGQKHSESFRHRYPEMFEKERLKEEESQYGLKDQSSAGKIEEAVASPALQMSLFDGSDGIKKRKPDYRIVGQVFGTYWIVEYQDQMYMIDQHAAHEKILYERTMRSFQDRQYTTQQMNPPMIIHLSGREEQLLSRYMDYFTKIGFEIEHFGERDYAVRGIPDNLLSISKQELLIGCIDSLGELEHLKEPEQILERVASMSCKAAVKGNTRLSFDEAKQLIDELLTLEQPFHCPHGRPTIITLSRYEIDRKFKRII